MSIYENPEKYAELTLTTLEQAKIRCEHFLQVEKEMHEVKKCPKCGKHTLEAESGSYEEGYGSYLRCENSEVETFDEESNRILDDCYYTSGITSEYMVASEKDYDVVLAFSYELAEGKMPVLEKHIGCSWTEFVDKDNEKLALTVTSNGCS